MAFGGNTISKIGSSWATLQNETTFALSNLNLDFTLIKLEAPKEYSMVGATISKKRKEDAEEGKLHRTARKLGALFENVLPPAQELFRNYGTRVSEICEQEKINPRGNRSYGLFSGHVGADSASIWAAVTSGDGAIGVHLLACMLARMFPGPEAISIWMGLIAERRKQIERENVNATDELKKIAAASAAKQEITREEVANWDNSARSWIQSADLAKAQEHKRAMFMTENTGLQVNSESDTYTSVVKGWTDAMIAMNNLILGIPQRVQSGAVVLGMTSWHLYPDLIVLSHSQEPVKQDDHLIAKSGILTVGLESKDGSQGSVAWSLPLAYMRYYGPPVSTFGKVGLDTSRISMDQFGYILLGCVFLSWGEFARTKAEGMKWILRLLEALKWPERSHTPDPFHLALMQKTTSRSTWIGQLLCAAEEFESGSEVEQGIAMQLIGLGQRQRNFLCDNSSQPAPLFGLSKRSALLSVLDSEGQIKYLRHEAKESGFSNTNFVIRYFYKEGDLTVTEFATIQPVGNGMVLRSGDGYVRRTNPNPPTKEMHFRWLAVCTTAKPPCKCRGQCIAPKIGPLGRVSNNYCGCWDHGGCSIDCHDWKRFEVEACGTLHSGLLQNRIKVLTSMGEQCLAVHVIRSEEDNRNGGLDFGNGINFHSSLRDLYRDRKTSKFLVRPSFCVGDGDGDHQTAEIVKPRPMTKTGRSPESDHWGRKQIGEFISAKSMAAIFNPSDFNYERLTEWFASTLKEKGYEHFVRSLRACASAAEIYKRLPDATVDLSMLKDNRSLHTARWIPEMDSERKSSLRLTLSRSQSFACIAMFEAGVYELDPRGLRNVFALSSGNSIFVATALLCDPFEEPTVSEIQRVPGNIGRAGLSLLVPPPDPRCSSPGVENWQILKYETFRGVPEDNFSQTSIHLSFTAYELPLQSEASDQHIIDHPTRLLETLAQVYDRTKWIADLDIMAALESPRLFRVICNDERHGLNDFPRTADYGEVFDDDSKIRMVSVDNWDELLTPEPGSLPVVRAHGNWLARLAATTGAIQDTYRIVL